MLMSSGKKAEKGGIDINLANLCRCMFFTHEDESDPKKHLVKMVATMDDVSYRLGKIESKSLKRSIEISSSLLTSS